ncbi:MAG: hypothetical protein V4538_17360 [Bacteroidota bacterium]
MQPTSKEDILKDLPYAYDGMLGKEVTLSERMFMFKDINEAMDIWANQQAISFAEFILADYDTHENNFWQHSDTYEVYTTEQLYNLFIQSTTTK